MPELPEIIRSLELQCAYERARLKALIDGDQEEHRIARQLARSVAASLALKRVRAYAALFGSER